ncbi:unnamed protein product, partial [Dicrocoelium dendriticum]
MEIPATHSAQFKVDLQEVVAYVPLYIYVTSPTGFRTVDSPPGLDPVGTNKKLIVDTLNIFTPLGRRDHALLLFRHVFCSKCINENM